MKSSSQELAATSLFLCKICGIMPTAASEPSRVPKYQTQRPCVYKSSGTVMLQPCEPHNQKGRSHHLFLMFHALKSFTRRDDNPGAMKSISHVVLCFFLDSPPCLSSFNKVLAVVQMAGCCIEVVPDEQQAQAVSSRVSVMMTLLTFGLSIAIRAKPNHNQDQIKSSHLQLPILYACLSINRSSSNMRWGYHSSGPSSLLDQPRLISQLVIHIGIPTQIGGKIPTLAVNK